MKKIIFFLLTVAIITNSYSQIDLFLPPNMTSSPTNFSDGTVLIDITVQNNPIQLSSMTIHGLSIGTAATAIVGARIYSATTMSSGTLLATPTISFSSVTNNAVTVPVSYTLAAGKSYRLGFFIKTPNSTHTFAMAIPSPPDYYDNSMAVKINGTNGSYTAQQDVFAYTGTTDLPYFTLDVKATTTGIHEQVSGDGIESFFPNPATTQMNIILKQPKEKLTVEVLAISGQVMMQREFFNTSAFTLDVADLSQGIYFLKMNTEEGETLLKFVKN